MRDVFCWRCRRRMFRVTVPSGVVVPKGIVIEDRCRRCRAINSVPLDTLFDAAIPCA